LDIFELFFSTRFISKPPLLKCRLLLFPEVIEEGRESGKRRLRTPHAYAFFGTRQFAYSETVDTEAQDAKAAIRPRTNEEATSHLFSPSLLSRPFPLSQSNIPTARKQTIRNTIVPSAIRQTKPIEYCTDQSAMCKNTATMRHTPNATKLKVAIAACGKITKPSTRKSVRFAGTVQVSLKSVSHEELHDAWYAPIEYKTFQIDSKRSLKAVTRNLKGDLSAYDASKHCLRGLEACLSPQLYQSRKEEKVNIVSQVLQEQLLHRLVGIQDPERLAVRSRQLSQQAQERALLLAFIDCKDHIRHQQEN
jgi:hypothetical protein